MSSKDPGVSVLAAGQTVAPTPLPEGVMPGWIDVPAVLADLADDGVSAPAQFVPGLRTVVDEARQHGVDLKVVYTEAPAAVYTQTRDLATIIGRQEAGTIMVRTPLFVGSVSDTVPRYRLEAAQDDAYLQTDPVAAAVVFRDKIEQPLPPLGGLAGGLLVVVLLAVVGLVLALRRRRA